MSAALPSLEDVFEQCCDMDASLAERLATFAEAVRTQRPAFGDAVERLVRRLRESGAGEAAPKPGDPMPPFVLPDETGQLVSLEDLLRQGPVAVTFHRGHWCPYCRININALTKVHDVIVGDGAQIVAIIPERQQYATEFKINGHIPFPVLIDMDNGYAMSLNLAANISNYQTASQQAASQIGRSGAIGPDVTAPLSAHRAAPPPSSAAGNPDL